MWIVDIVNIFNEQSMQVLGTQYATFSKRKPCGVVNKALSFYNVTRWKTSDMKILATNYYGWRIISVQKIWTNWFRTWSSARKLGTNKEAEFLDVPGTKVLRVFLLAIHSHLY
jgi:hypothetical protein